MEHFQSMNGASLSYIHRLIKVSAKIELFYQLTETMISIIRDYTTEDSCLTRVLQMIKAKKTRS